MSDMQQKSQWLLNQVTKESENKGLKVNIEKYILRGDIQEKKKFQTAPSM